MEFILIWLLIQNSYNSPVRYSPYLPPKPDLSGMCKGWDDLKVSATKLMSTLNEVESKINQSTK